MTKKLTVLDFEVLSPSPARKTPTPPDVYWRRGEDGPIALCGPCARRLGLSLLDTNGKEPCAGEKCAVCAPKDEKEKGRLSEHLQKVKSGGELDDDNENQARDLSLLQRERKRGPG